METEIGFPDLFLSGTRIIMKESIWLIHYSAVCCKEAGGYDLQTGGGAAWEIR